MRNKILKKQKSDFEEIKLKEDLDENFQIFKVNFEEEKCLSH